MLDPDPEARPTLDQLLYWVGQLIQGQPLPEYILTPEAQQKRIDRIAANNVRAQKKGAKKPQPVAAPKATQAGVASDSVAAKRLAAKRGGLQSVSTYQPSTAPIVGGGLGFDTSSSDGFAADFGAFGSSTNSNSNFVNASSSSSSVQPTASLSSAPVFDAFGGGDDFFQPSSSSSGLGFQPTVAVVGSNNKHDTADFLFDTDVVDVEEEGGDGEEEFEDGFSLPSAPSPMKSKSSSLTHSPSVQVHKQPSSFSAVTPNHSSSFTNVAKPSPGNQLGFDAFGDNFTDPFGAIPAGGKSVFTPPVPVRTHHGGGGGGGGSSNSRHNSNDFNAFEPTVASTSASNTNSASSSFGFDESFLDGFSPSVRQKSEATTTTTNRSMGPAPTTSTTPSRPALGSRGGSANSSSSSLKAMMVPSNLSRSRDCRVDDFGLPVSASVSSTMGPPPPSPSRMIAPSHSPVAAATVTKPIKPIKPAKPVKNNKPVDLLSDPIEYGNNTNTTSSSSAASSVDLFSDEYLLSRPRTTSNAANDPFNTSSNPLQPTTLQNQSVLRLFDTPPQVGSGSPMSSARSIPGQSRPNLQSSLSKTAFDLLG